MEQIIRELEAAAQIIMAPPNVVSSEQRHSAETVLLDFRKSKAPYSLCKEILEKSQNEYILFEAAQVLKDAVIREWSFLLETDRVSLKQYLMQYVTTHKAPHFVRDRIVQIIAIMVKRISVDDMGKERGVILQDIESLIINAEPDKKFVGCNLLANLMQEYACSAKSTDIGLSWEVHFKARKEFEATDLKRIFQFCIYLLSEVVKNDPPYNDIFIRLTRYLLQMTERVLTWCFISPILPKRLIGIYESLNDSEQAPPLKLDSSWSHIIFDQDLVPLVFQIYWKLRDVEELSHHAMSCLVQLASLSGGLMNNDESRLNYFNTYLVNFFKLISNVTIKNKESLGISNIVRKLVMFYIHDFPRLTLHIQDTLLDELTRLTCHFCDGATQEDSDPDTDKFFTEAFENMLEAWATILQEFGNNNASCATTVFNKYVQCHLAPPDGTRSPERSGGNTQVDEDIEDNDRKRYKEQLQTIGMFGRCILQHSLPLLYKIIESRTETFLSHLQLMQHSAMNINQATTLDNIFEDLHWALLISGHVLCMESDGEVPLVPSEVMTYSLEQGNNGASTVDVSVNTLLAVESKTVLPANISEQCDHVIRILFNVMRLCSIEDAAVSMKLGHFMSPELGSTLMWFFKRWCLCYLLPDEALYYKTSPILIESLGKGTESAKVVVGFILNKIGVNLYSFQTEPILLKDTVSLFNDLVYSSSKSVHIVKTEAMAKIISLAEQITPGTLPPNILRDLYKGFVLAGVCFANQQDFNTFYETIFRPLQVKFKSLIGQENFATICQGEQMQKVVIDMLESFVGIAKGSLKASTEVIYSFASPILADLPVFMRFYKDYQIIVQLILEFFGQIAKNILCYLKPLDTKKFYDSALATIQTYANCNINRLSKEKFSEESSVQDLSLVLDLLTFILSKDCIDFCTIPDDDATSVTASDVTIFGLKFIMPLMTLELLKFPTLCAQYYRLLVLINDIYPEKIEELPQDMLSTLLESIEIGLTNYGVDILQACLDFIQGMVAFIHRCNLTATPFGLAMKHFLKILMDLSISHKINLDMMSLVAGTVYTLITCYRDEYQMLIERLIGMQADPLIKERLTGAFNALTLNITFDGDRQRRTKFKDNFERFIYNVQGFLLIK